jgi:phenylpropionate dioxygenase-like ring-hydroxylating dioxygenase large terminal subunit
MFDNAVGRGGPNHWYAVCRSQELKHGPVPCSVLGQPLVLFRDTDNLIGAVLDRCAHRNAPLSCGSVRAGRLVCPYHGWEFDRAGRCQNVPGFCGAASHHTRTVPSYPAVEQDGLVWVFSSTEQPAVGGPPQIELLRNPGYVSMVRDFTLEASLVDAVENFLDPTHTHFVHTGLVRNAGERRPVRAIVRSGADQVEAEYFDEAQTGLIARFFGAGITRSLGRFRLPSTVQLEYWAGATLKLLITQYFTPVTLTEQHVFAVVVANPSPFPRWLVQLPFAWMLGRVVRQDQHILAMQSANLRRFGGPRYTSTELDLLRPHIVRLLEGNHSPSNNSIEKQVTLML